MGTDFKNKYDDFNVESIEFITPSEDSGGIESAGDLIDHLQKREDIVMIGSSYFEDFLKQNKKIPAKWYNKEFLLPDTIKEEGPHGKHVESLIFGVAGEKPKKSGISLSHPIFDHWCVAVIHK